jgi:elongation factor 1-gamma
MLGARLSGAPVELENVNYFDPERENLKKSSPTETFPLLKTPHGNVSETQAILQYLLETYKPELLGSNHLERALVRQWQEFAALEVSRHNKSLIYPIMGWTEYNKTEADNAMKDLKNQLAVLNRHLEGKTYLVGDHYTNADLVLFSHLKYYYTFVLVEDIRNKLFPNVTAWYTKFSENEHVVKVYGRSLLCKVPLKAPHLPEKKKEEPKKEHKKEEKHEEKPKKGGDDEEEEDKPQKKKPNPLDLLPPSSFVLDDFKREFLNSKDRPAVLKEFWNKLDPQGFSLWFMQYQKLPSEGKILFKTKNSASFFLQKLDAFRKYSFSAHGVYGEEGNYEVRGVWMWRGTDIPEEVLILYFINLG